MAVGALVAAVVLLAAPEAGVQDHRLAGLARVWGRVRYVHPAMATSHVDWDAALVRAIPDVLRADSDQEYRAAIDRMLDELDDPATRVIEQDPIEAPLHAMVEPAELQLQVLDPTTAIVTVPNDAETESNPSLMSDLCAHFAEAARLDRVVVDLRGRSERTPGWGLLDAITRCAPLLWERDVALAPARFLEHGFYMMQSVAGGAGGGLGPWRSGLTLSASGSLRGEGLHTPRLVFIVDRRTVNIYPLLMALQAHGMAQVVLEGDAPAAGVMVETFEADDSLAVAIRHGEWLRPDGGAGFLPDAVVPAASGPEAREKAVAILDQPPPQGAGPAPVTASFDYASFVEKDYSEIPYPDEAHRLLALFRLYNVIEYFFPYKDLMDQPWGDTLLELIPPMRHAKDATDYALTVAALSARLQDSHVTLSAPVLDAHFGTHRPDLRVDLIEGQTVVTDAGLEAAGAGVRVGDVLVSVDGEHVAERRARLARYLSASTPGRLQNKVDTRLLLGPRSLPASLELRGQDGDVRRMSIPRVVEGAAPRAKPRAGAVYQVLPQGYGYVDLERLAPADVDAAFELIRPTDGLIVDMRGYPTSAAWLLVPRFAVSTVRAAYLGGSPRYDGRSGRFFREEDSPLLVEPGQGDRYEGRIVVLADASTQSAAETVCLMIKAATDAVFVGSQTSGANGGVTRTILPGGIVVNFTGYPVRDASGGQFQRVGMVPDVEAHATLQGIRDGRDELLERAIDVLNSGR